MNWLWGSIRCSEVVTTEEDQFDLSLVVQLWPIS
jgi:hypothetical protein